MCECSLLCDIVVRFVLMLGQATTHWLLCRLRVLMIRILYGGILLEICLNNMLGSKLTSSDLNWRDNLGSEYGRSLHQIWSPVHWPFIRFNSLWCSNLSAIIRGPVIEVGPLVLTIFLSLNDWKCKRLEYSILLQAFARLFFLNTGSPRHPY